MATDNSGRDVLSRIVYGARLSLRMGFIAIVTEAVIGTMISSIAGTYGGWTESVLMRFVDALMAITGLAITVNVIAANLIGDGVRDALDPRLKV